MKREANRQPIDDLYILGAGASKALTDVKTRKDNKYSRQTTPIDKDFLKVLNHFSLKQGWQKRALELVHKGWLDKSDFLSHGLEEAIIKRVAHYDLLSSLYPEKSRKKCSNPDYLNNLSHLITDYLIKCKSNSSKRTKDFVNHVFPPRTDVDEYTNRIITFNYDLIIDRPLIERGLSKKKIYFDRIAARQGDGTARNGGDKFPHPLLLKMHGSINWRCSKDYFSRITLGDINPDEKITIWTNDTKCPQPDDGESPLIIPPIPNKPITKTSIFKSMWTTAFEYLHEAKRIIIVGYSCPSTDVLAQSMFTQFRNMNVEEIVIVDPSSEALPKYADLMHGRIKKSIAWRYYRGFDEYVDQEIRNQ